MPSPCAPGIKWNNPFVNRRRLRLHEAVNESRMAHPGGGFDIAIQSTLNSFADVKERLIFAIENRGLVVSYIAHVGAMLERTGGEVGSSPPIYTNAEVIEFCSAALSRATMEADPHNIAFCPYSIAVYALAQERERVYVAFRMLAAGSRPDRSRRTLLEVDKLLADIVREALT